MKTVALLLGVLLFSGAAFGVNLFTAGDFEGAALTESETWTAGTDALNQWYAYPGMFEVSAQGDSSWGRCIDGYPDANGPDVDLVQAVAMPAAGTYTLTFDYIDTQTDLLSFDPNRRAIIWLSLFGMVDGETRDLYYLGDTHQGTQLLGSEGVGIAGDFAGPGYSHLSPTGGWVSYSVDLDTTGWQDYDYLMISFGCYGNPPVEGEPRLGVDNVEIIVPGPSLFPGDADESGTVDLADLAILATNWNMVGGATWGMGDFNDDGNVDLADLAILATNWNQSAPVALAAAELGLPAIPEPATLSLLGLGALALIRRRR